MGVGIGTLRPNVTAGCNKSARGTSSRLNQWFNTACFTAPPLWGFGSESRVDSSLRQDGVKNLDFRTEFFNIFNHAQFAAPNTTQVSPNFGVVTSTLGNPRQVQFGLRFAF